VIGMALVSRVDNTPDESGGSFFWKKKIKIYGFWRLGFAHDKDLTKEKER